ncbi:hypothetical protein KA016_01720 [Candidatus Saccharibacteria bacterium]|jgi:hypothetical protein|nr:hypothetical protein [Candidatus Saccharibacteria bacterium]
MQAETRLNPGTFDPTSEATLAMRSDQGEALAGLPFVEANQADPLNPDRSLGFPNLLYHSSKDPDFTFDTTRNHRNSRVGIGANTGEGMYFGTEDDARQWGNGNPLEFIPSEARLLDLSSEESRHPLSAEFKDAYIRDFTDNIGERIRTLYEGQDEGVGALKQLWEDFTEIAKTRLITTDDIWNIRESDKSLREPARELAAQMNIIKMLDEEGVSIADIFSTFGAENTVGQKVAQTMKYGAPMIDFLTKHGVDGAVTEQRSKQSGESFVVFWKMDRVGDAATWQERQRQQAQKAKRLGAMALPVNQPETVTDTELLQGKKYMGYDAAEAIATTINNKKPIIENGPALSELVRGLGGEEKPLPIDLVKKLAATSKDINTLLAATTGVTEGYRLHEHTQAVVGRFFDEFADRLADGKQRQILTTALLLQDIGKSLAVARQGNKEQQTHYNRSVANNVLGSVDDTVLSPDDKKYILALIGQDIIGGRLQNKIGEDDAIKAYDELKGKVPAAHAGTLERDMKIMYMCDASAYTGMATYIDADGVKRGAVPSLDHLFVRDQKGRIRLAPRQADTVQNIFS